MDAVSSHEPAREAALVPADPESLTRLLSRWGFPADASLSRARRGSNNQTFLLRTGDRRFVLRISGSLSVAQVHAEHRILERLRQAGLPFAVPEPVPARDAATVVATAAGPATVCRWIPGAHPDLDDRTALAGLGRTAGLLGEALRAVPLEDGTGDWRTDPLRVRPGAQDVAAVVRELRGAGISAGQTAALEAAARRAGPDHWPGAAGPLPAQVIHGDLGASNMLVDQATGRVNGVLDFEFAGPGFRVQEFLAALYNAGALDAPDWPSRTAAFAAGYASVHRLDSAEAQALPGLLLARSLGSALWRADRWRAGRAELSEVGDRLSRLAATVSWLAANAGELRALAASGGQ
jgi:homoserine kinase type II